jgi:DNA polymerase-3 subunit beta
MKFNLEKDQMMEALQKVQSIVGQRTTLPILSNILLEVDNGLLTLTATDQEVSVRTSLKVDVIESGATTLPARHFFSICKELPDHQIDIEVNEADVATIRSGSYKGKLEGLSKVDFPPMPSFTESFSYKLDQVVLRELLQKTFYAASTDESRAILNGSLMAFRDNKLTIVCTDGRRLALIEKEIEISAENELDIVVPTKTTQELIKTLKEEGDVFIKTSATQVAFEFGDMFIISKLIEGTYPNYRQVIPSQCEERIAIDRNILQSAVRRVSLMLNDQTASVKVKITENKIELLTSSPEIGEASESIPVKYSGKDITIAFNPAFMIAPLKYLESDEVYLELSDELSPGVIKSNIPFLYVIMPIRIN